MEFHGRHLNLQKVEPNLHIVLNNNGRRIESVIHEIRERLGSHECLLALLHDHFKRRWTEIKPEEIGALTAATIISDEAVRDLDGILLRVGRVYWHERYQVEDPIEVLLRAGFVRFDGA